MFHLIWWLWLSVNCSWSGLSFYVWFVGPSMIYGRSPLIQACCSCSPATPLGLSGTLPCKSYCSVILPPYFSQAVFLICNVPFLWGQFTVLLCLQNLGQFTPSSSAFPVVWILHQPLLPLNFYRSESWYKKISFWHSEQSNRVR